MDMNIIQVMRQRRDSVYYPETRRSELDDNSQQFKKIKIKAIESNTTKCSRFYTCFSQKKTDKRVAPN